MTDTNETPVANPEPTTDEPGVKRPDQKGSGSPAESANKPATGGEGAAGAGGAEGFGTGS